MQIVVYYDVVYCTLHYDVISPNFTCALITEHIHVLNLFKAHIHFYTVFDSQYNEKFPRQIR